MEKQLILRADSSTAAAMICRSSSPDAALLYLHLVSSNGRSTVTQASEALKIPDKRIIKAFDILLLYGIVTAEGSVPPRTPVQTPAQELVSRRNAVVVSLWIR